MSTIITNDTDKTPTSESRQNQESKVNKNLRFLSKLDDYKVHHDDVDPRGYSVKTATGETIGKVEGLLADLNKKVVRYVEVEVEDDVISRHTADRYSENDRHALLPVGLCRIDTSTNTVQLMGIELDNLVDYPRFQRDQGYTTRYEIETNDYLSDFHEYGNDYKRDRYAGDNYRTADALDDEFYTSSFYTKTY